MLPLKLMLVLHLPPGQFLYAPQAALLSFPANDADDCNGVTLGKSNGQLTMASRAFEVTIFGRNGMGMRWMQMSLMQR